MILDDRHHVSAQALPAYQQAPGKIDMLDTELGSRVWLDGPCVPSWAFDLEPCARKTRSVLITGTVEATQLDLALGVGVGVATARVPRARDLPAARLREVVSDVFGIVIGGLRDAGFPHPVRMWAFVPGIHDRLADGLDRYRVFNTGRYDAFTRWFGSSEAFRMALPAASAVGHGGNHLVISALGLPERGIAVENPRQIPAFGYSHAHGPKPPCFSRAMLAKLPIGTRLLVSGTASIRGEDSVHHGSLENQLAETFANLHHLVQSIKGQHRFSLSGIETSRVYFPRAADRTAIVEGVSARLPAATSVEYVPAWICRPELLVEIEATLAPARSPE